MASTDESHGRAGRREGRADGTPRHLFNALPAAAGAGLLALLAGAPTAAGLAVLGALAGGLIHALRRAARIRATARALTEAEAAPSLADVVRLDPDLTGLGDALVAVEAEWQRKCDAAEARAQQILDAVPDALLLVDGERRITRMNRVARRLFGRAVLGGDLAAAVRAPEVLSGVERALTGGGETTAEIVLAGPVMRVFEAGVAPFGGDGAGALVVLHDLTEVKRSEQLRVDFVANASHEIRSPLAAIVGFLETLRGPAREDPEARERFLAVMADEAARMTQLVEDLLSLSKIEMREHTPPTEAVRLRSVIDDVLRALANRAEQRGMTMVVDPDPGDIEVTGDADELALMLRNFVLNSLTYGRRGTPVRISVSRVAAPPEMAAVAEAREAIAIAVIDQSEGIPREHVERLTERFYRVDKGRSRKLGGTGLGLAIVKHVVNRHRGVLTIESTPGKGSTFTVFLPAD